MPTVKVNNINLHYSITGQGEPLLLLHGAQGDSNSFNGIIGPLSEKFQVINFDQRGAGQTDKPDMEYTMELLADDAAALLDELSIESAHVLGVSLGGMIAQALCIRHPQKVKTVMMGCSLPGGWSHAVIKETPADALVAFSSDDTVTVENRARALANVAYSPGYADQHPEIIERLIAIRKDSPVDKVGMERRLAITGLFDAYDDLEKITCPCFVITGKGDQLLDYKNSEVIANKIRNADLKLLEPAGHIFWEEQKSEFLKSYLMFIETSNPL
ncbi:MAG: alpha/beta hydrolase [Coxiellaceae bacterium]|nr:alpha/beta hydrolase [Coxiellaceae bacterium]